MGEDGSPAPEKVAARASRTDVVPFDPLKPYGEIVESTVRVVSWNTWDRFGPWSARQRLIEEELHRVSPDLVALQETWRGDGVDPYLDLSSRLGMAYAPAMEWFEPLRSESGTAVLSTWPIERSEWVRTAPIDGGNGAFFQYAAIHGPHGAIDLFVVMLDWRPDLSHVRQQQVMELCAYVKHHSRPGRLTVVCGDLNASPDSDEVRMLTGRAAVAVPGLVFYDAWEMAGNGTAGWTWSNDNAWAGPALRPNARIDYILSAALRAGGVGHPVRCSLIGTSAGQAGPASDHYGLLAELRY